LCVFADYNPDRAQKLTSSSMSRYLSTRNISSKSMHAFLSNLANRQTDKRGQTNLPPSSSEINYWRAFTDRLNRVNRKTINLAVAVRSHVSAPVDKITSEGHFEVSLFDRAD